MNYFKLPDLGEGLQEAEVIEWHVSVGDEVKQDQTLVSVETAKAIVDLPSPQEGKILRFYGKAGDIIHVGDPLVEFESEAPSESDTGTVVGKIEIGDAIMTETPIASSYHPSAAGFKATPAVRALASRLKVDLAMVKPSGRDNIITADDIRRVAKLIEKASEMVPLKGVRRAMALTMSQANSEVVPVTISDDADINAWKVDEDISIRLIRAIVAGCKAEPSLNAWYDHHAIARILHKNVDLGIAVDTNQGLFVPVLRNVSNRDAPNLREGLEAIKEAVKNRSIPPEEMRGSTIALSNFGTFAGRYANPMVIPPTVAILGAGKIRDQFVVAKSKPKAHKFLPLSLTVDHRAVTGGEAARFLSVMLYDLGLPE